MFPLYRVCGHPIYYLNLLQRAGHVTGPGLQTTVGTGVLLLVVQYTALESYRALGSTLPPSLPLLVDFSTNLFV